MRSEPVGLAFERWLRTPGAAAVALEDNPAPSRAKCRERRVRGLDTDVLVRYLTDDDAEQSTTAARVVEEWRTRWITARNALFTVL